MIVSKILIYGIVLHFGVCQQKDYSGYKLWKVTPNNTYESKMIVNSWELNSEIDFWHYGTRSEKSMEIMVAPDQQNNFRSFLSENKIKNEITFENVERIIEEERAKNVRSTKRSRSFDFNHYWRFNKINEYLDYLTQKYPRLCSKEYVSNSTQGRSMYALRISLSGQGQIDKSRPIVSIDAGIHAREWITPMTALYFMHEMIENVDKYAEVLKKIDIVIVPLLNPDGYEYSHDRSRLWRKSRSTGTKCHGVDLNRNFPFEWRSSSNQCSETYPGRKPFSEPEIQAVHNILEKYNPNVKLYINLHSFGGFVLYPWGNKRKLIKNWKEHHHLANAFARKIKIATKTQYKVGNSAQLMYITHGSSSDYASSLGVKLSFVFELPGKGFILPPEQIKPIASETWLGFQEMLKYVATKGL